MAVSVQRSEQIQRLLLGTLADAFLRCTEIAGLTVNKLVDGSLVLYLGKTQIETIWQSLCMTIIGGWPSESAQRKVKLTNILFLLVLISLSDFEAV